MTGFFADNFEILPDLNGWKYEAAAEDARRFLLEAGVNLDRVAGVPPAATIPAPLPVAAPPTLQPAASSNAPAPQPAPIASPPAPRPSGLAIAVQDQIRRDASLPPLPRSSSAPKSGLAIAVAEMIAADQARADRFAGRPPAASPGAQAPKSGLARAVAEMVARDARHR